MLVFLPNLQMGATGGGAVSFVGMLRGRHHVLLAMEGLLRGVHRIELTADARWEFHKGEDAEPDFTAAPWETALTLPHTTTATITKPGAGSTKAIKLTTRKRNQFGLTSLNQVSTTITIDENGDIVATPPADPSGVSIVAAAAGAVRVKAEYDYAGEDPDVRADVFLVYLTANGVDPVPGVDSPTEVTMLLADGIAKLDWTSGTFADGLTAKTIVQVRRSGTPDVDSDDATVYSVETDTDGPATPDGGIYFAPGGRAVFEQRQ